MTRDRPPSLLSAGRLPLLAALALFLAVAVRLNLSVFTEQQFTHLARAFVHGQLSFLEMPGTWADATPHDGRYYWCLGPLPAVILVPFAAAAELAGTLFYQGWLQPWLVAAVFALAWLAARRVGHTRDDAAWLAFGFCFATAFLGVAMRPWSWYFAQVVTCALLFGAICEMTGRRREWVVGTFFALALATRVTAGLGILWPAATILASREPRRERLAALARLLLPVAAVVVCLMLYNQARFGDPFDNGYTRALVTPDQIASRGAGLFSPAHLPGNLYHFLLGSPLPVRRDTATFVLRFPWVVANPWGMGLFVTSPVLVALFFLRLRDSTSRLLLATSLVVATPILLYYHGGFRQFGFRYALDFLPLVWLVLMRNLRTQRGELGPGFRAAILASALFNLWLFAGHFVPGFAG